MHWWDQHVEDLETTDLEEICHQVLDLYAQPVTATKDALVSPPPGAAPKVSYFFLVFRMRAASYAHIFHHCLSVVSNFKQSSFLE